MGIRIFKHIKYIFNCMLDVIYDKGDTCILCKDIVDEGAVICSKCSSSIVPCKDKFFIEKNNIKLECYSFAYYSGIMKELIRRLKYQCDFEAGRFIAQKLEKVILNIDEKFDVIEYVPSSKDALKKRGYNQCEYIAKIISEDMDIPILAAITKIKATEDQIGLGYSERWNNIENSFMIKENFNLKNKKILLIDDVITTGATVYYCSKVLLEKGAGKVIVLTSAKSSV